MNMKCPKLDHKTAMYNPDCQEYLRQHIDDLPLGRPISYEEFCKYSRPNFVMKPEKFVFSCKIFNSQGGEQPIFCRLTHLFTGVDARFYARAKTELLSKGKSPLFLRVDPSWMPVPTGKAKHRQKRGCSRLPYSPATVNRMARYVWDNLLFRNGSALKQSFSLVMSVLECRLMLEWTIAQARYGRLPKYWVPYRFAFEEVKPDLEGLVGRTEFLVPSRQAESRFLSNVGIKFCIPVYTKISGLFAGILKNEFGAEVGFTKNLPAYFVTQNRAGWKAFYSNVLTDDVDCAGSGTGKAAEQFDTVLAAVNQHLIGMLVGERKLENGILIDPNDLGSRRYVAIRLVRMTKEEQTQFYEGLLAEFNKRLKKVFASPQKFLNPKTSAFEQELDIKVYAVMKAAFEQFFGQADGALAL